MAITYIIEAKSPVLESLRVAVVGIITFMLSMGITYQSLAYQISRKPSDNKPVTDESGICYIDEDYFQSLSRGESSYNEPLSALGSESSHSGTHKHKEYSHSGDPQKYKLSAIRTEQIALNSGWNLISLPLDPADHGLQSVLSSISGSYRSVWTYESGSWKRYIVGASGNNLFTMETGKGYWIMMLNSDTLEITGSDSFNKRVHLDRGWNWLAITPFCNVP